ncbi:YobI family P-loop NTPase [Pseudarthrobacter oxydans]|uniref:YobI family P-loop NTPase n=1 Tax=Pseudarthrobacter oxydans TaxID=1671 RepID=UPI00380A8D0A
MDSTAPKLTSLAPNYSHEDHGVYFTILKRAIDEQPHVRNIALAGTYGTGKSSILRKVSEEYKERVIELSLLTLGVQPEPTPTSQDSNPAATSTTNRIQKEIVKQLLYQQRPADAPESRFRRIVRFRWRTEITFAATAGVIAAILAFVAGLDAKISPTFAVTFTQRPPWLAVVALYLAVALAAGAVLMGIRALIRGRVGIEKVTAGPATITLPPRSTSYFDEYLDEIIYFFEMNVTRDIVIVEDLDRFNEASIFEALRSLNGLLNAAGQLKNRDIRFVYAVRDSVFEKLGRDTVADPNDGARMELVRANRTKFFELVIPVVPFITHKNARDLMHSRLEQRGHKISKDLIDLAARHLADMRLVHNIINEYEVFKHRLLDVNQPVPELDAERLFAMVVFKNAHMGDFEKIRHAESSLDSLWKTWRAIVNENLNRLRDDSKRRRIRVAERQSAPTYAQKIGAEFRNRINALASAPYSGLAGGAIYFDEAVVDDGKLQSPQFWHEFVDSGTPITVKAWRNGQYNAYSMQFSRDTVETLLGMTIDDDRFVADAIAADEQALERNDEDIAFLRRHSWKDLSEAGRFKYTDTADGNSYSFRVWVEKLLPSRLAADLVIHGYITSYFSLHVSAFYGQLIRPDAMVYVMRSIDHGTPEPDYPLEPEDVEAILRDQGTSVLTERSMFNIGILNHLLVSRPEEASVVVHNLLDGSDAADFLDLYLDAGSAKSELVAQLSPVMPGIFIYLAGAAPLERKERVKLVDTAIAHRSHQEHYEVSDQLRELLEAEYRTLPSIGLNAKATVSAKTVTFISSTGAVLPDLVGLPDPVLHAFRGTRAYVLTAANLECVANLSELSLDALQEIDGEIFAYATDSIQAYLKAFTESPGTKFTVGSPEKFAEILNASKGWTQADFDEVVLASHPDCRVRTLSEVPAGAWPALVRTQRVPMTFKNIDVYVETFGEVDESLAIALATVEAITDMPAEQTERARLALDIINASTSTLDAHQRVRLAVSLNPGELDSSELEPLAGPLLGELIAAQLIPDDEDAFRDRLMIDWGTQSYAVARSANFADFVSPDTLQPQYLAAFFASDELSSLHSVVATKLSSYSNVPREAFTAAAKRAIGGAFSVDAATIDLMRRGGVGEIVTIELLAASTNHVSIEELQEILRSLGGRWSKVADRGWGVREIEDSSAAVVVLERLQGADIVSKFPLEGSVRRVSLRQP